MNHININQLGKTVFLLFLIIYSTSCYRKDLRGKVIKSRDSETYLVILDDCNLSQGSILVDGHKWNYPIGEKGKIEPGEHTIDGCGKIKIVIKDGTIFYFDYWGP
jgi:hypothetical protein